jgi:enoyl-CoA hydratase/carnithine racemase
MIELRKENDAFVLHMKGGENRFNPESVAAISSALDEVERTQEPVVLVTVGEGKFYSNGLDLEWLSGPGRAHAGELVPQVSALLGRLLTFPAITVAAMNGHTFAAGAMFALAHDFRVMRSDRGYFCLPEVDLRMPFPPPMAALVQARLSHATAHEAMVTGKRYGAEEALRASIVQELASEADVLPAALALARRHTGKTPKALSTIKQGMYAQVLALIGAQQLR